MSIWAGKAGGADVIVKGWEDQKWLKPEIEEFSDPERVEIVMQMVKRTDAESMPTGKESARSSSTSEAAEPSGQGDGLSCDQVGTKLGLSRDQVEHLLTGMKLAASAAEIRQLMGMTNASKFKKRYLDVLIDMGIVEMTQPDSPKSPTQKYFLTELGKSLLEAREVGEKKSLRAGW